MVATDAVQRVRAILCDIDGTVADHDGVRGHFEYDKVSLDRPKWVVIEIVMAYYDRMNQFDSNPTKLIMLTGRPDEEQVRKDTETWLTFYGIDFDELIMRPEFLPGTDKRDFRADDIVKEELYKKYIEPHYDVPAVFDDRNRVVEMWRRIGLTCLQVADGNF